MLSISGLNTHYGASHILQGVDLEMATGRIAAILGRNGVGKTTTVKTIMGLVAPSSGSIMLDDNAITGWAPHRVARAGVAYVPEGRLIFPDLSVIENIKVAERTPAKAWPIARLLELFPSLDERQRNQGSQLSGGEQQMLAIGRILRTGARLLLLDEPTEGLAPVIIQQIGRTIRSLKERGFTILLVEQNFRFASTVADRYYVMEHGRIIHGFANADLEANMGKLHEYLGV